MDSLCDNDKALGPSVRGCRGGFDFTSKFEHIFLALIPSAVFITLSIARVAFLAQRKKIVNAVWWQLLKLVTIAVYTALQLSILLVLVTAHDGFYDGLAIASAALAFVAALSMIPLSHQEHSKTPRPSMLLSSFLFLTLLFDIVQTRTLWLAVDPPRDSIIARLFTTSLAVKAVVLLIEARRKARWLTWNPEEHSPEETSGLFSLGVFSWLNKLFLNGYKKILGIDDLYALDKAMATERTAARISDSVFRGKPGHNKHALAVVMVRALVTPLLLPIAPRIALIGFNFCQPFFINALLDYLQGSSSPNIGHGLIGASALTYTGIAISTAFYWYYTKRVLYMVRGVLVSAIYKKTTVVRASTAGDAEAITLMSTDVERIMQGLHNMHEFWANIIEAALGCWLLQRQLGLAFMAPVVVILVCLGCVSYLGTLSGSRQREWMDSIQRRVGLTAEILPSMKHLHIAGIAAPVSKFIQGLRIDEINSGNRFRILFVVTAVIAYTPGSISPVMAYAVTSANLDVSTIYTSLSYILLATKPLAGLFQAVPTMIAAFTCLNRIQRYLEAEEQAGLSGAGASYPEDVVQEKQAYEPVGDALPENTPETEKDFALDDGSATQEQGLATPATLRIVDGSFGWTPELYALSGINITVPSAKLTMIVGPVASGKSTLCKALLGEVPFSSGRVLRSAHRTIAYCEQTPFLSNTTVKENIVGFAQFSQERYDEVIEATMLSIDMTQLPSGHGTRIGSSGIMLSGGQKQRVALARALYAPAQLLIFDDILSGLDDDTAAEIFRRVFGPDGLLRRRDATAVLCTHSVRHLPAADHIIALTNGIVVEEGTFDDLMANRKYVHSLNIQPSDSDSGSENDSPAQEDTTGAGSRQARDDEEIAAAMDDRTRQTGDWRVYKHYFSRVKLISLITFFVCTVLYGTCRNLPTVWMNYWAGDLLHRSTAFYIGIYTLLSTMQLVFMFGLVAIVMSSFISSSGAELHAETLRTVVSAPLRFFTTTDIGVVTNLFSQDMTLIDSELPLALANFTAMSVDSLGMAAVIAVASPYVAVSYPVLFLMLYAVQKFYLRTSRQMRLLDLEAKSPLYAHFLDTIRGLATIRAFNWTSHEIARSNRLIDISQRPAYLLAMIQQWLELTMQLMVAGIAVILTTLATQLRTDSGLTGASMVTLMGFGEAITIIIRYYTLLETSLGAVARIKTFSEKVPAEDIPGQDVTPPEEWPQSGEVQINGVSASYFGESSDKSSGNSVVDGDTSNVLKDVRLKITAGEKVAICGRSGSGKSSLILLLLRLLDPLPSTSRNIVIDDLPLHRIDRSALRNRIIAVPQDAIFLSAGSTMQSNLDPLGVATYSECLAVLEAVQLAAFVASKGGMMGTMSAGDLSAGQKQLLSLGRAVLRRRVKARTCGAGSETDGGILLLDEVSSSVDQDTDRLMQEIIRKEFAEYTVIMVSHRLGVVRDFCDRVVVMDKGSVVETGRPGELIEQSDSRFGELWRIAHGE